MGWWMAGRMPSRYIINSSVSHHLVGPVAAPVPGGGNLPLAPPGPQTPLSTQSPQTLCAVSPQSLNNFLASKGSPLEGQGQALFSAGRQYNVDPRFIVALAGAETSFGKTTPWGAYNAWDWGYNGTNSPFSSWAAGIYTVTEGIAGPGYMGAHPPINGPVAIYSKYCPPGQAGCTNPGLLNLTYILENEEGGGPNITFPCDRGGL